MQHALAAAKELGNGVRVVSMPCTDIFERQDESWHDEVLPPGVPVVAVEAGATRGWWRFAGCDGAVIGLDRFGESAPERDLFPLFGFTAERVANTARDVITRPVPPLIR